MSDADPLKILLDKQEITELLTRYLRSVDRGDVATLRSCYLAGATEDHGGLFEGPAADYVDSIAAGLTHPRSRTSHNMTNLLIECDGDTATAESYCITFARIKADGAYYHSFVGARMLDRLERRDGAWGIAHRQLLWDWNHDAPAAEHWMRGLLAPDPSVLRLSGKYPADPLYASIQPVRKNDFSERPERESDRSLSGRMLAQLPDRGEHGEGGDRDQDAVAGEHEPDQVAVRLLGDPFGQMTPRQPGPRLSGAIHLREHGLRVELGSSRPGEPRLRDVADLPGIRQSGEVDPQRGGADLEQELAQPGLGEQQAPAERHHEHDLAGITRRMVTPSSRASAIASSIQLTRDNGVISTDSQPHAVVPPFSRNCAT